MSMASEATTGDVQNGLVEWEVLNPDAEYETIVHTQAPRLGDLNNKRIGLFWNAKPSGDRLLSEIAQLLQQRFSGIELIKFDLYVGVGAENIKLMAQKCDGVVAAIGD
jgi:hypothetical protein